ncbi:MAG: ABC transporter substrate-binding protein [Chloroflexi bacterium]|nr:ABC transporter substrate-binding protein [Chloroflexota bacterium]MDA1240377.1 ABC transporter substrate-binding protein [Chloroflexota bacterium]MQC19455.1 ABC transporter substrate-binding protein [Chloroflexota bacterium]
MSPILWTPGDGRPAALDRRTFLRAAGVGMLGLAGAALIGCGEDEGPAAATPAPGGTTTGGALEKTEVRVGYLPITDSTPLVLAHGLDYYTEAGLTAPAPTLFRGWAQIAEAFQARQLDVVHLLMPMAIWLRFGQNVPLRLVAWNHTGGSALTVANRVNAVTDLSGHTVAIPFWYSVHNVVLQMLLRDAGLKVLTTGEPSAANSEVKLVVMAPPDMPTALANGSIEGYIVADPFNAVAEVNNVGKILRFIPDVWFEHACCVAIMHEDDVAERPNYTQAVVNSLARAQVYARENRSEAARILSGDGNNYLPQPRPVIERALTHYDHAEYVPTGAIKHPEWETERIDFQPFPYASYTEELIRQLKETVVEGDNAFLANLDPAEAHRLLVDDRYARTAIDVAGGAARFDIDASLTRDERISV